jgi:prepilin signal peptidase PulO-like enzyme (type II secretory pathway)
MHTTVTDPHTVLLAGDIITWATNKTNQIGTLAKLVAGVLVIVAIIGAYWRTKSWVATAVAFLLGALVLWGIANMPSLQTKVGSEVNSAPAPHIQVAHGEVPAARGGLGL